MRRNRGVRWLGVIVGVCGVLTMALALIPTVAWADGESHPVYQTLGELAGKRFAYVNGSVYNQNVEERIEGTSEQFYPSLLDCVAAVEAGKADAAVQISYCCELVVNRKGGDVAMLPEKIAPIEEAFFFPRGDSLVGQFNGVIARFEKDGTIERLTQKWVGSDESAKTLPKQDWDAPNGTLKFATSGVLEPFSYVGEGGEPLGYDVELALLIAKELGYHLKVSTITMDAIFASVEAGKVDFGGTLTRTDERAQMVDFTTQVMPCYISAIVKAEEETTTGAVPEYKRPSDLVGKTLGSVSGGIYDKIVTEAVEGITLDDFVYFDTPFDSIPAIESGKIDAFIEGRAVGELTVARNAGVTLMPEVIAYEEIGICLKKDSPLTQQFNERIAAYKEDGTLDALHDKWMGADEDAKTMPEQDWDAPNGELSVMCSTLEPMAYVDGSGRTKGYEAELVLDIARDLGYTVKFSNAQFAGVLAAVESGKADVAIGNISITEERKQKMDFTDADYDGAVVAVVRATGGTGGAGKGFFSGLIESFRKTFLEENRWQLILSGLGVTVVISVCAGVLGTLLGFATVLARRGGVRWIGKLVDGYQAIMGGVPLVVILMVLYYVVFGSISINGEIVAILAFTLSFGSTSGSTMWTAVDGIDIIQEECGLALGYTRKQVFRKIIFPQAMQQFLPQLMGQFVSLVKDTAVVGYIAVQDLTRASDLIRARTMDAFFPLVSTAIIYFLFCRILAWVLGRIAAKIDVRNKPRKIEGVTE